jgi:hypothetical protein
VHVQTTPRQLYPPDVSKLRQAMASGKSRQSTPDVVDDAAAPSKARNVRKRQAPADNSSMKRCRVTGGLEQPYADGEIGDSHHAKAGADRTRMSDACNTRHFMPGTTDQPQHVRTFSRSDVTPTCDTAPFPTGGETRDAGVWTANEHTPRTSDEDDDLRRAACALVLPARLPTTCAGAPLSPLSPLYGTVAQQPPSSVTRKSDGQVHDTQECGGLYLASNDGDEPRDCCAKTHSTITGDNVQRVELDGDGYDTPSAGQGARCGTGRDQADAQRAVVHAAFGVAMAMIPCLVANMDACHTAFVMATVDMMQLEAVQDDRLAVRQCAAFLLQTLTCVGGSSIKDGAGAEHKNRREAAAILLCTMSAAAFPRVLLRVYQRHDAHAETRLLILRLMMTMYFSGNMRAYIQHREVVVAWVEECARGLAGQLPMFDIVAGKDGRVQGGAHYDLATSTGGVVDAHALLQTLRWLLHNASRFTVVDMKHHVTPVFQRQQQLLFVLRAMAHPKQQPETARTETSARLALDAFALWMDGEKGDADGNKKARDRDAADIAARWRLSRDDVACMARMGEYLGADAESVKTLQAVCEVNEAVWNDALDATETRLAIVRVCQQTAYCRCTVRKTVPCAATK